ncbi:hypothetical protein Tsubulata_009718 [Turnera subulata]|uniref:Shugoshin C-terminal domain-containing protein n=1 Tax=Turnera subulata TaxID=218843 RepID=A0A9Q0F734_9ROSI|nr:hypothetical protein Tsubulata_009718 [Turnera subulata]
MKGERMAKRSSFGCIVKSSTNAPSQTKLPALEEEQHSLVSASAQNLINQLLTEKAKLVKLVEERKIMVTINGVKRLTESLVSVQELNLGRDKVKALQHELVGKEALLKAKNLELEGKADVNCQNISSQDGEKPGQCLQENSKASTNRSRRRAARSKSMGPSTTNMQNAEKEKAENKRRCLRRQSARFKSQEKESKENLFEIEDAKFALQEVHPFGSPVGKENCDPGNHALATHRSSMGRPLRRAAEKVQSYKEVPINVKMRRNE